MYINVYLHLVSQRFKIFLCYNMYLFLLQKCGEVNYKL